jgi:asparagine synthase (glutamine-hydrolysing)
MRADRRAVTTSHAATAAVVSRARAAGVRVSGGPRRPRRDQLRAISLRTLRAVQDSATSAGVLYGAHRLQLTQPFHDKRVVELALAIPEDLYFKDGRPRHLARTALADLYPPEFQTPPAGNIPFIADYREMIDRIRPQIAAEIARLEQRPRLAARIDFRRLRRLSAPGGDGAAPRLRSAARVLLIAQYLDAFWRDNA